MIGKTEGFDELIKPPMASKAEITKKNIAKGFMSIYRSFWQSLKVTRTSKRFLPVVESEKE